MPQMPYGAEAEPLREEHVLRMSVKLDGMTPAGLPADLNHRVQFAMQVSLLKTLLPCSAHPPKCVLSFLFMEFS